MAGRKTAVLETRRTAPAHSAGRLRVCDSSRAWTKASTSNPKVSPSSTKKTMYTATKAEKLMCETRSCRRKYEITISVYV